MKLLDPIADYVTSYCMEKTGQKPRQLIRQVNNMCMLFAFAFMFYKSISVVTQSASPVVVVLSGSMEPAFQRGDILFLDNRNYKIQSITKDVEEQPKNRHSREPWPAHDTTSRVSVWLTNLLHGSELSIGDIVVYNLDGRSIPIVHRVTKKYVNTKTKAVQIMTKGDNNPQDDTLLYPYEKNYLEADKDVMGRVRGYIPYLGYMTIIFNDYPIVKGVVLGGMALFSLLFGDE